MPTFPLLQALCGSSLACGAPEAKSPIPTPASSFHGGCPPIAEHQEFAPCMPPPGMTLMQHDVIVPNPGYKIAANLWDLKIAHCAHAPSPLATFLRHCNTMESLCYPTYSKKGTSAPADVMSDLNRNTSSIENLRELQKYSEKLAYESTCCRLWSEGIQTQIVDEQEKVQAWIAGVTEDVLRMKRIQPAWTQPMLHPGCPSMQKAVPCVPSQPTSSSSASTVPVKPAPAPLIRNPSMAAAPQNDPWVEAKMKQQRQ